MKKNSVIILSTLLLGTTLLRADKFWEKKGSAEWTRKEVIRMMYKSPWAHRVEFRLQNPMSFEGDPGNSDRERLLPDPEKKRDNPRSNETGYPYEGREANDPNDGTTRSHSRYMPQSRASPHEPSRVDPDDDAFFLPLTVRWYALPIRHAIDRRAALRPEAKQVWNSVQAGEFYLIGVSGLPAHMFPRDPDRLKVISEHLKAESFLKIKGREPIPADAVIVPGKRSEVVDVRDVAWRAAVEIYVVFSRGQKGSQVITLADKKVDFVTRIGSLKVKRKFKLKDMVYNGKLEL